MSDWREAMRTWVQEDGELSPVGDTHERFYSLSMTTLFRLNKLARPLIKTISTFLGTRDKDQEVFSREMTEEGGMVVFENTVKAVDPSLAALRHAQMQDTVDALMDAIDDPQNRGVLALIVMDSMRERGFPSRPSDADLNDFLSSVSGPVFGQMLLGVWAANKGLFGEQEGKALGLIRRAVGGALGQDEDEVPAEPEDSTTQPSGSDSPTE